MFPSIKKVTLDELEKTIIKMCIIQCLKIMINITCFVYPKALIQTFHSSFLTRQYPLGIHSNRIQIQKAILYSTFVLKISSIQNKSDSDLL